MSGFFNFFQIFTQKLVILLCAAHHIAAFVGEECTTRMRKWGGAKGSNAAAHLFACPTQTSRTSTSSAAGSGTQTRSFRSLSPSYPR
jgi:hypothetical protein